MYRELDLRTGFGGYGEATRTHWAIKNADLIGELTAAGVDIIGTPTAAQNAEGGTVND
ncbi:MAG: hypothetical protein FWD16_00390 [Clostridia bacterium]|nr:hypothetical protein [Clostridia bacterium]